MTLDEQILELPPKLEQILNKLKWLKVETRIVRGNICQLLLYYDQIEALEKLLRVSYMLVYPELFCYSFTKVATA